MPSYTFKDRKSNKEQTHTMSISELDKFEKKNPHLEQVIKAASIGDPMRLGVRKIDGGFRDVLKTIKKNNHGSLINTQ